MKGNVIGFDADTNTGAISGHDGNRYDFVTLDWRGSSRPKSGDLVDFQAVDRRATEIYLIEAQYFAPNFGQFYFSPSGRISRSQYWLRFMLPYIAITFVLDIIGVVAGQGSAVQTTTSIILSIFGIVALWPYFAILAKRIHDRNKSGWTILWLVIPNTLWIIFLFAWIGAAIFEISQGQTAETAFTSFGTLGLITVILGVISIGIGLWFFVEFGCLRGTIGANKYGPDPVR